MLRFVQMQITYAMAVALLFHIADFAYTGIAYHYAGRVLGLRVHFVTIDLNDARIAIMPAVSQSFPRGTERFSSFIHRTNPIAAINGTFFDTRTLRTLGDIVIGGMHINAGWLSTALAVLESGAVHIVNLPRSTDENLSHFRALLACGPRLLAGGRVWAFAIGEGFKDKRLMRRARRSAIGLTPYGKLIMAVIDQPATLTESAKVMRALGCTEAMNLDGGSSCGLYCGGRMLVRPRRRLTNVLLVFRAPRHPLRIWQLLPPTIQPVSYKPKGWFKRTKPAQVAQMPSRKGRTSQSTDGNGDDGEMRASLERITPIRVRGAVTLRPTLSAGFRSFAYVMFIIDGKTRFITNKRTAE
ncbi:MAG TPA: phosphodiester glycosidase family protein, partial [Armatimonadetes bacterium]|nr:phosphodiester glycosidase family protein [Armatimonadota bacterium]